MRDYIKQNSVLHPPYIADKFSVYIGDVYSALIDMWYMFPNPRIYNNILYTNYENSRWVYEVCDTPYNRGRYIEMKDLQTYWNKNKKENQHYSMFAHDEHWVTNLKRTGSVSCTNTKLYCPLLWIEMDRKDYRKRPNLQKALKDAVQLKRNIQELSDPQDTVWAFTSGNNSSHVAVNGSIFGNPIVDQEYVKVFYYLALKLTRDLRFANRVLDPYRLSKDQLEFELQLAYPEMVIGGEGETGFEWDSQTACSALENIDPNIYRVNSLIRQPFSVHESSGRSKSLLDSKVTLLHLKQHKPYLLHLWFEAWEQLDKKPEKVFAKVYESSYIIEKYLPYYPDINKIEPDHNGWVGPFHSVLYNDSNPSVYINLDNGYHQDFGNTYNSITLKEFFRRIK